MLSVLSVVKLFVFSAATNPRFEWESVGGYLIAPPILNGVLVTLERRGWIIRDRKPLGSQLLLENPCHFRTAFKTDEDPLMGRFGRRQILADDFTQYLGWLA